MYQETKRLIKKAVLENKLVVFVGAGVSLNSGIPLWGNAIEQIKVKLEPQFEGEKDYLKIPQFYYNARGFKEYNELVKEIFDYADKVPNELHRKVFELKPSHIITTNYDDFLERVADENGEFLELIERDSDIPYAKNDRLLVKMHGGFNYDNYVLKEDDYLNYSNNFKLTETLIKSLIARYTVLFVGYSFNDPDTKQILNWVKNSLGDDFQRAYMILGYGKYNQTLADYYKNLGINLIFAERCLGDKYEDSHEKIFENTMECLDYFIQNDQSLDLAQKLYGALQQYENLNFIKLSYIQKSVRETNKSWEARIEGHTLLLNSKEGFSFFEKLMQDNNTYAEKIRNILSKTQLFYIALNHNNGGHDVKLEVNSTDISCVNVEFWKMLKNGNYVELKLVAESTDIYNAKTPLNVKMETAYFYYKINEKSKCSNILGELSKQCKKQKNYLWHFISEFNLKHVHRQNWLSPETTAPNKNLQEIIFKYNLYSDENSFLLEIANFSLFHEAYYQANEMLKKVPNDNVTFGIQEIHKLEYYVMDIYNFMSANYLMIEKYTDIKNIFQNYLTACLVSHLTPVHEKPSFLGFNTQSYAIKEMSEFSILSAIEYCNYKELMNIFSDYSSKEMTLHSEATNLLIERTKNYFSAYEAKILNFNDCELLNRIAFIASKSSLQKEDFYNLLNKFICIFNCGYHQSDFINLLNNFIVCAGNRDIEILDENQLNEIVSKIIDIQEAHQDGDIIYQYRHLNSLFLNILELLRQMKSNINFNEKTVSKLINGKGVLQFLCIYDFCTDAAKKQLVDYVNEQIRSNSQVYMQALYFNIIKPNEGVENILLSKLEKLFSEQNSGVRFNPDPYEMELNNVINLKLNGYLLQSEKFAPFLSDQENIFNFLNDMDNFDYSKFDLNWIVEVGFSKSLLKLISAHSVAKSKIAEKFKEKYKDRGLKKSELDIYFEYFF